MGLDDEEGTGDGATPQQISYEHLSRLEPFSTPTIDRLTALFEQMRAAGWATGKSEEQ